MAAVKIFVVSGYFATFHEGHKEYIDNVIKLMNENDKLIVIISNHKQFEQKYVDYNPPFWTLCQPVINYLDEKTGIGYRIQKSIDLDMTQRETLSMIVKQNPNDLIMFCKDGGEYNKDNLPEKEVKGITFMFLDNPKIANASEILNIKKREMNEI